MTKELKLRFEKVRFILLRWTFVIKWILIYRKFPFFTFWTSNYHNSSVVVIWCHVISRLHHNVSKMHQKSAAIRNFPCASNDFDCLPVKLPCDCWTCCVWAVNTANEVITCLSAAERQMSGCSRGNDQPSRQASSLTSVVQRIHLILFLLILLRSSLLFSVLHPSVWNPTGFPDACLSVLLPFCLLQTS